MSALLAKLNLAGATLYSPADALAFLASGGQWGALAQAVSRHIRSQSAGAWPTDGTTVKFTDIGLTAADFTRTTATATKKVGEIDYSGITMAARSHGLKVRRNTDGTRSFVVPADPQAMIDKCKAQAKKSAAAQAAKKSAAAKK